MCIVYEHYVKKGNRLKCRYHKSLVNGEGVLVPGDRRVVRHFVVLYVHTDQDCDTERNEVLRRVVFTVLMKIV